MTERIPEAAFWCLAVGLLAVIVLLVRQRGITRRQRGRSAELATRCGPGTRSCAIWSRSACPRSTAPRTSRLRDGAPPLRDGSPSLRVRPAPARGRRVPARSGSPRTGPPRRGPPRRAAGRHRLADALDALLERFSDAVRHAQARADQSAKAALKASMR